MEIAPGIDANDWIRLKLNGPDSGDWADAIFIFCERIRKRYLIPARYLIDLDEPKPAAQRTFGFSIMAINCLLAETLQSFIDGVLDTSHQSEKLFVRLLATNDEFSPPFDEELAREFYRDVRCGILHIGETQRDAVVWSVGSLVTRHGNSIRINRTEFYRRLEALFIRYSKELENPEQTDLRQKFREKMDFVARKSAA